MASKAERKRELIVDTARGLFQEKGFASVTMKDIVQACEISRGGVYLYFASVDEIFLAVLHKHNQNRLQKTRRDIEEAADFPAMLHAYFARQKRRLLHMETSLTRAMYEYGLSHSSPQDKMFYRNQFNSTKDNIVEIFRRGVEPSVMEELAMHVMFTIEGLSTLALTSGVEEALLDEQFALLQDEILRNRRKET